MSEINERISSAEILLEDAFSSCGFDTPRWQGRVLVFLLDQELLKMKAEKKK